MPHVFRNRKQETSQRDPTAASDHQLNQTPQPATATGDDIETNTTGAGMKSQIGGGGETDTRGNWDANKNGLTKRMKETSRQAD